MTRINVGTLFGCPVVVEDEHDRPHIEKAAHAWFEKAFERERKERELPTVEDFLRQFIPEPTE